MKWEFATVHEKLNLVMFIGNVGHCFMYLKPFFENQCFQYSKLILYFFNQLLIVTLMLNVVLICYRMLLFKTQFTPNSIDTEMKFP